MIDGYSGYEGQTRCAPAAKPGVLAFRNLIVGAYPYTGLGGISRACNIGGQSEHKEGRAWDWGVAYSNLQQRHAADEVLDWLAAEDRYGNDAAMARRLGIMYAIWNKRIWFPGGGWRTYCVMKRGACRDPEDHDIRDPHTSHVHFSFTWAGARKQTTFWNPSRSAISSVASNPYGTGLWSIGANGGVRPSGSVGYFGSKSDEALSSPVVAAAPSASGYGYWMVTKKGKVFAFGDAQQHGSFRGKTRIADIASSSLGTGYWLLSQGGRVTSYGRVKSYGNAKDLESKAVSIAATPSGKGYWILLKSGRVLSFGDATQLGDAAGTDDAVDIAPSATGLGYWIATSSGRVQAFGDALELSSEAVSGGVVGIVRNSTGNGYWLVKSDGSIRSFGDAVRLQGVEPDTKGVPVEVGVGTGTTVRLVSE